MSALRYSRVLLKLSGEVLKGGQEYGFDRRVLADLAARLKELREAGCELGVVIGGGNIWRHRDFVELGLERTTSDTLGMMATVMNACALADVCESEGLKVKVLSSFPCESAVTRYTIAKGREYLSSHVVVFAGGTGSPFFTTDSAAALRALESRCDIVIKATKVDYVYDKDPELHKDALQYTRLTYQEVIEKNLQVMDLTCAALLKEGQLPMIVCNINDKDALLKAVRGAEVGTFIS